MPGCCAYCAGYFNGALASPQALLMNTNSPSNRFPASIPMWVLGPGGCSQWGSFAGSLASWALTDINFDGNMDIVISGAMQSVVGVSTQSSFTMNYGGASGAAGSFNPAPFVDNAVNGLEVAGLSGGQCALSVSERECWRSFPPPPRHTHKAAGAAAWWLRLHGC